MSKPKPTAEQQARTARVISQLMLEHDPPVDDTGAAKLMGMDRGQWRRLIRESVTAVIRELFPIRPAEPLERRRPRHPRKHRTHGT